MFASVQARAQLSKCSLSGSDQGALKIVVVVLEGAHHRPQQRQHDHDAHRTSMPWEKTLRAPALVLSSARSPAGARLLAARARRTLGAPSGR